MTTHVKVLQHHIDQGLVGRTDSCPVALALLEQFPGAEVQVDTMVIQVLYDDHLLYARTPDAVRSFIASFDARCPGHGPFEFDADFATERYIT